MKKIVHIFVPDSFNTPYGGMGVGSLNFIKRLSDEFDFYIIGFPEKNDIKNYTGVYNPLPQTFHGGVTVFASQVAYYNASVKLPKPDLVHAYDWSVYLAALYTSQYWEVPLVVSMRLSVNLLSDLGITYVHDIQTQDGLWINRGMREMELIGLREADSITCVSESYAQKFEQIEGLKNKISVVPNGIDLKLWQNFSKQKLPGTGKIKLVYIGRFVPMKGIIPLLNANLPDDIDLIFVGSDQGADLSILQKIQESVSARSNVHFVGPKYGQEKIDYLNSADAVIVPSVHEPFGIVALEALASSNILLSSRIDGMGDFLNDENSIYCGYQVDDIENAFDTLISLKDGERENLIQKGLHTCEKYNWDDVVLRLKEVYDRAIK